MSFKIIRSYDLFLLLLSLAITLLVGLSLKTSKAETPQELAPKFAPVLHFTQGEKFYPASVDHMISRSVLKRNTQMCIDNVGWDIGAYFLCRFLSILIPVGLVLLALDVIEVKSGKSLGRKLII